MAKNKFFAFFNTEADFVRFMIKYLDDHPEILRARDCETRRFTRIWQTDFVIITLGRMGFRETRLHNFNKTLEEVRKEYIKEYAEDLKCDATMEYSRELMEREIKQYTGKFYVPEKERYK